MPRRTTTAELRDRLDGLGIAMFAIVGVLVDALAEIHPDGEELWDRMPARAAGLLHTLEHVEQDIISEEAIDHAFAALTAAFAGRREVRAGEAGNDNEPG